MDAAGEPGRGGGSLGGAPFGAGRVEAVDACAPFLEGPPGLRWTG
jgi:hypothetical protein